MGGFHQVEMKEVYFCSKRKEISLNLFTFDADSKRDEIFFDLFINYGIFSYNLATNYFHEFLSRLKII